MLLLNKKQHKNFWAKVDKSGICWEWTGNKTKDGYGLFGLNYKTKLVHRISYEIKYGDIPEGLQIDHTCRNRSCVNPVHLESVTQQENMRRGLAGQNNKIKTRCPKGHEYTPDNIRKSKYNKRGCKTCDRISNLARYHKNKQSNQEKKLLFKPDDQPHRQLNTPKNISI